MDAVTFIIMAVGFSMVVTAIIICVDEAIAEGKEDTNGM